jgi:hypothetical protein
VTKDSGGFTLDLEYLASNAPALTAVRSLAAYGRTDGCETRDRVVLPVSTTFLGRN